MVGRAEMRALVDYCREAGIRLVSDEIYHGICFDQPGVSALELTDDAVVLNSFSKYFSMTGWRLGWMVLPEDLLRPAECPGQNLFLPPPCLSQLAAAPAFDCPPPLAGHLAPSPRPRPLPPPAPPTPAPPPPPPTHPPAPPPPTPPPPP